MPDKVCSFLEMLQRFQDVFIHKCICGLCLYSYILLGQSCRRWVTAAENVLRTSIWKFAHMTLGSGEIHPQPYDGHLCLECIMDLGCCCWSATGAIFACAYLQQFYRMRNTVHASKHFKMLVYTQRADWI